MIKDKNLEEIINISEKLEKICATLNHTNHHKESCDISDKVFRLREIVMGMME